MEENGALYLLKQLVGSLRDGTYSFDLLLNCIVQCIDAGNYEIAASLYKEWHTHSAKFLRLSIEEDSALRGTYNLIKDKIKSMPEYPERVTWMRAEVNGVMHDYNE